MKSKIFFLLTFLLFTLTIHAQSLIKIGFRAGLNVSHLSGPSETDDSGNSLEKYSNNTGFLVGVSGAIPFDDYFGVRAEFLYSINGGRRLFESSNAYQKFSTTDSKTILTNGYKRYNLNAFNSYLELPLSIYGKLWKKIELSAGICPGVLISSTGTGEVKHVFSGTTTLKDKTLVQELDFNFKSDKIGATSGDPITFNLNTEAIATRSILTAYQDFSSKTDNYFNNFDMGILAGLSYYFNGSLFAGARLYYGLNDVTNKNYDISLQKLESGKYILRDDFDRNIVLQFMIGFQF
ncbi:MAG: PorT family protein [Saprospiraceae bacterium]|jgi:hypothetical protein|nr:PorT family protein [Saprospiraceae bacterium]